MDVKELTGIKDKIEKAKQERSRAEGAIQNIKDHWKNEYGFNSIEEAENELEKVSKEIDRLEEKQSILEGELKQVMEGILSEEEK